MRKKKISCLYGVKEPGPDQSPADRTTVPRYPPKRGCQRKTLLKNVQPKARSIVIAWNL